MAFPQSPLDVGVDLLVGGVWTDITQDVYLRDPITITRGRHDEGSRVDPGSCALTLNNRDGKYSPRNPLSPYFGQIGRNTKLRVSVPAAGTALYLPGMHGSHASTPDAAVLDITGDIDIRVDATLDTWYVPGIYISLVGKWDAETPDVSYTLVIGNTGHLVLAWSTDGTSAGLVERTSTVQPPTRDGMRLAVRATLDVDNAAGGHVVTFYTADTLAGPWTQLGDAITGTGTTSIHNSVFPLKAGDITIANASSTVAATGRMHAVEVRNGIGGTVVANPDFTAQTPGAASFTDGAGRVWTLSGDAEITNRVNRFAGEVSSWPTRWDVSGRDVWVPVQASGILRRLGQGASPLQSAMRREFAHPTRTSIVAYWPLEDGQLATEYASAFSGADPMRVTTAGMNPAAYADYAASDALPTLGNGAASGAVPAYTATGETALRFVLVIPATLPAADAVLCTLTGTGTVDKWTVSLKSNSDLVVRAYDNDGSSLLSSAMATTGTRLNVGLDLIQSGADVSWRLYYLDVDTYTYSGGGPVTSISGTVTGQTVGTITRAGVGSTTGGAVETVVGHVALASATAAYANTGSALVGWAGEPSTRRIVRLCVEEGIPLLVHAYPDLVSQLVGPQRIATLLDLLEEAADVGGGVLGERRDTVGLAYRDVSAHYNQLVRLALDYAAQGEVAPPLEPVDDDHGVRNYVVVKRDGGSSATAEDDTGPLSVSAIGRYEESLTLNLYEDTQAADVAWWRLHLGTWDEARYPLVHVNLAAAPHLIDTIVLIESGHRSTIANPPSWLPPDTIDLLVEGDTETLGLYAWDIMFNCSPAGPWNVFVVGDRILGRADTSGSELASSVTASGTSLLVATDSGYRTWITTATHPTELPFNVQLGGEVVRVTAITGTTSPQTFTVVRGVNGVSRSWPAGTRIRLSRSAVGL